MSPPLTIKVASFLSAMQGIPLVLFGVGLSVGGLFSSIRVLALGVMSLLLGGLFVESVSRLDNSKRGGRRLGLLASVLWTLAQCGLGILAIVDPPEKVFAAVAFLITTSVTAVLTLGLLLMPTSQKWSRSIESNSGVRTNSVV